MGSWIPVALRCIDLLIKYGPTVWSIGTEVYKLVDKLRKEGKDDQAHWFKSSLEHELVAYGRMPRRWRRDEGKACLRSVRAGARKACGLPVA